MTTRTGVDPRTKRTLAKLEEALTSLLRTKSLGEISVSELCRTARIHRTTFYKHFSSAGEFASSMLSGWIDALTLEDHDDLPSTVPDLVAAYENALRRMFEHIAENRDVYRRMLASDGDFDFQRKLVDLLGARATDAHRRFAERGRPVPVDEATAAQMVGAACAAARWVWAAQEGTDAAARSREVTEALPAWWQLP